MLIEPGNLMDQKARIFVIGVGGGGVKGKKTYLI